MEISRPDVISEWIFKSGQTTTNICWRNFDEEENSCKEIHVETDSQEHSKTTTSFQNNDDTEDYESQSNPKKTIIHKKKKQKPHNAIQESASTTLMKYLVEKKGQENKASHPIDNFFFFNGCDSQKFLTHWSTRNKN